MDFTVSESTLQALEETIYDINLELLKEVHTKFLGNLDFQELQNILDGKKKKKFILKIKPDKKKKGGTS